jgi:hypothetical protein
MKNYGNIIACSSCARACMGAMMLTGCQDNNYDLGNLDKNIAIGSEAGLALPGDNSTRNIVLDDLQLHDARVDTRSFIGDMRLQGTIGQLQLSAPGISPAQMLVELRQPRLSDTDLTIYMSDTAAVDTSTAVPGRTPYFSVPMRS